MRNFAIQTRKLMALTMALGLLSLPVQAASVGAGWEPTPLIDPNAVVATPATATPEPVAPEAAGVPQVNLEEALKPVIPFIEDVEKRLFIQPEPTQSLADRLNNLQAILFGEQKYQDAAQLIGGMAELFPEEAAKAEQALMAQQQEIQSQMASQMPAKGKANGQMPVVAMPSQGNDAYAMSAVQSPQQAEQWAAPAQAPQQSTGMRFPSRYKMLNEQFGGGASSDPDWDKFDDDWDEGFTSSSSAAPAYSSNASASAAPQYRQPDVDRGSTVKAVGQGLLSLAGVAGALAGGYYMNKKMGGGNPLNQNYNGNPYYGNQAYGNPYGYGSGYGYGNPYGGGYGNPYGAAYANPYGMAYGNPYSYTQPYGGRTRTIPYTGMNRTGSILPF